MKDLKYFKTKDFYNAFRDFFKNLNIPVNYIAEEPARPKDILSRTFKEEKDVFQLMEDVYFLGMVDDAAFEGGTSLDYRKIESDYDGILIFGVTLHPRENGLPPTRSQLAEIARAFNREFHYTPVVVVFRYANALAFANAERLPFKQEWREGEKAGKVSLLRDIDLDTPHSGHLRILSELAISRSGKQAVNSFAELYSYWQTVFNVSLLNKKFYEELSNWYFWAIKEVSFPGQPTAEDVAKETGKMYDTKRQEELRHEHNAKNVIRLLTRFLFVWFIKEKKLIPPELFDLDYVKDELVKDLSPYHQGGGLFQSLNTQSHYYKAILQNLFFATLNQEMGKREFRKTGGQHMNVTNLLRYKSCFKNSQKFIDLVEAVVPFMNGGLFECLDKPHPTKKGPRGGDVIIYEDGFSDRDDNPLVVPDYLFFGLDEEVDLSRVIGIANKKTKQAAVKGLINIFESYKFTIAENTPIEEDIALDPELLGKVFENLLASYNPETKTTARKQTGSFYTPREIVNYMVDESLIAYLKNAVADWGMKDDELDAHLHKLLTFDPGNPFPGNTTLETAILKALDNCTILDPACGSGAFPMGILQKMVHVLQKLDPDNSHWKELQRSKALQETESAFHLVDKEAREQKLLEINEAFDEQLNDPDYARKLFLIENCIYGVDIQPIAVQISKLRFFISLVVDQKVDKGKKNFGIRPLPNLETKFVAANTLIGIKKPERQGNLFANPEIKEMEEKLQNVRHRIFSAKTPRTKRKLREDDQALREKMGKLLIDDGWANITAKQLASWDPYDQNEYSRFFDPEWMFGMNEGFDVVIGNPPYVRPRNEDKELVEYYRLNYLVAHNQLDLFHLFIEYSSNNLKLNGINSFIISNAFLANENTEKLRNFILKRYSLELILDIKEQVFEGACVDTIVFVMTKKNVAKNHNGRYVLIEDDTFLTKHYFNQNLFCNNPRKNFTISLNTELQYAFDSIKKVKDKVDDNYDVTTGIKEYQVGKGKPPQIQKNKDDRVFNANRKLDNSYVPEIRGRNLTPFCVSWNGEHISYGPWLAEPRNVKYFKGRKILIRKIPQKDRQVLAVLDDFFIADQSIYVGKQKTGTHFDDYYAVGVLSSILTHWYFKVFNNENDDLFPQIKTKQFKELPVKFNPAFHLPIQLVSKLIHYLFTDSILSVLDALVFELYFSDIMEKKQINILQFVEKDLTEVMQGRDFEHLQASEKENVIKQFHARWSDPDSEVRNRIKLFAVRSPDILKPILESR